MKSAESLQTDFDLLGVEEEGVSREIASSKGPSLFTPKKIPHFKEEKNIFLWASLRLMLALWTIEESPFFLLSNVQLKKFDIVPIAVFGLSIFVLFVSFFSAVESLMRWLLMIWSTTSLAYHLLNFTLSKDPSVGVSKDLLVAALLPIWGSLHSLPLALLWVQQLAAFLAVVSCTLLQERPLGFTDWEFVAMHALLTLLGMVMVYTHQASAHSVERDSELSSRMYKQTSRFFKKQVHQKEQQVQSERDMALFISHEVRYMAPESVTLSADVPPDVWVLCDEQLISQVLVNLVANALKFTSWGFVLLRVRQESGRCIPSTAVVRENNPFEIPPDIISNNHSQFDTSADSLDFAQIHPNDKGCRLDSSSNCSSKMSGLQQSLNLLSISASDSIRGQRILWHTNPDASHPDTTTSVRRYNSSPNQSQSSTPKCSQNNTSTFCSLQSIVSPNLPGSLVRRTQHFSRHQSSSSVFRFEVCDTGPGIKEEKQGKLFQRFQQAGNHFGAGLGLMLSQKIIQFRGGNIELVSPTWTDEERGVVNVGSVFKFALQMKVVTPSPEESLGASRERDCALAIDQLMYTNPVVAVEQNNGLANLVGLKVLLIDDSRLNLKQLKHKLTQQLPFTELRWLCEMALSGKKALEILARSEPFVRTGSDSSPGLMRAKRPRIRGCGTANSDCFSIAVVDSELNLDDEALSNGHEVIRCIRKMEQAEKLKGSAMKSMLIISYSGHIDQEHQGNAIAAGADIVWSKPLPAPRKMLQDIMESCWWASFSPPNSRMDYIDLNGEQSESYVSDIECKSSCAKISETNAYSEFSLRRVRIGCDSSHEDSQEIS